LRFEGFFISTGGTIKLFSKIKIIDSALAIPGRDEPLLTEGSHYILSTPLLGPFDPHYEKAIVAMGCFWGAERLMWQLEGVFSTAVGYCGGFTKNPTYEEVCSGKTGHSESVLVVFDPQLLDYETILKTFYENHDPTQYMRQGNDIGTQYRSAIYCLDNEQLMIAGQLTETYQKLIDQKGLGPITTEITMKSNFYYAENYHQQYLAKNPGGYCGLKSTGIKCPS